MLTNYTETNVKMCASVHPRANQKLLKKQINKAVGANTDFRKD